MALELYAIQARNDELENNVREIRNRAARKGGEPRAKASGANQHKERSRKTTAPRTLAQMGLTKDQSSEWQALADVPDDLFEEAVTSRPTPSVSEIVAEHEPPQPLHPQHRRSLWVTGILREFERDGHLDADPSAVIECMAEEKLVSKRLRET